MIVNGLLTSPLSVTSLINMYSKCNHIFDAFSVFNTSNEPNVFAYNAIIAGFIYNDMLKPAITVYGKMRGDGVMVDRYTVPCVVKAFSGTGDVFGLKRVHGLVFKVRVNGDMFVGSSFVHGYLKFGMVEEGYKVFEEMPERDVVLWNAMINGYAQIGEVDNALECLRKLRGDGCVMSRFTMTGVLSVLTLKGDVWNGRGVHGLVTKMGYFSGVAVCNALIDMYGKCKCFSDAMDIFEGMAIKDIYSWNSIIGVHQQSGDHDGTLKLFNRMLHDGSFCPDLVTVTTVLPACSHLAALRHGKEIHGYMITKGLSNHNSKDRAGDTYINNAVMDMYGKCGSMKEARLVFDHMSTKDSASWNIRIMVMCNAGVLDTSVGIFKKCMKTNATTLTGDRAHPAEELIYNELHSLYMTMGHGPIPDDLKRCK
ncbi:pentatricopeptide repeat-containing protein [Tanacetum coccineum]